MVSKHRDELSELMNQLEMKNSLIESLTDDKNILLAQNVKEKAIQKTQLINKHQEEVESMKGKIHADFRKKMDDREKEYERNMNILSQCSSSLKEKVRDLHRQIEDKDRHHRIEIENLSDTHITNIQVLSEEKEDELIEI